MCRVKNLQLSLNEAQIKTKSDSWNAEHGREGRLPGWEDVTTSTCMRGFQQQNDSCHGSNNKGQRSVPRHYSNESLSAISLQSNLGF